MKPVDYRNETWEQIEGRVSGMRARVYDAWWRYGPCTTRELADRAGLDILEVRPRTTELVQLGLVDLAGEERGTEGRYRAMRRQEQLAIYEDRVRAAQRRRARARPGHVEQARLRPGFAGQARGSAK